MKYLTEIILIVVTVGLVGYNIYAAISPDVNTISRVTWAVAQKHPILPFVIGVICGHLFWGR